MASQAGRLRRAVATLLTALAVGLLVVSLALLAQTTQNSEQFGRLHLMILAINALGVVVLTVLITGHLVRLAREYRRHTAGARLKARMVGIFTVLAVVPLLLVYGFSIQFLTQGIDSWFNDEVERGLDEALNVSRTALEIRMREYLSRTELMCRELSEMDESALVAALGALRREHGATEIIVYGQNSRIVAVTSELPAGAVPERLPDEALLHVRQGRPYVGLEPVSIGGLQVRTAASLPPRSPTDESRILQAIYPVTERLSYLAEIVQTASIEYRKLAFLRRPLIYSFTLTLTLVLLLSLLAAVWGAIFSARRVVAPIQDLAAGTRAVAKGDFSTRLPVPARDEVGFLVNSFNEMTGRLAEAREQAQRSQQAVEAERANLETVLASLSSGVIALEPDLRVRIANQAALSILGAPLIAGEPLAGQAADAPMLEQFAEFACGRIDAQETEWRRQIVLRGEVGRRVLMCSCTALSGDYGSEAGGYVLVFDDITTMLQAQRDAAWGEVARRLAHEIKNPLTPIQLSAERLRRRYLPRMDGDDAQMLERATHTIIQQVEAMKSMVDAFRDYARAPDMDVSRFDLNRLIEEVCELYRVREIGVSFSLELDLGMSAVSADKGRIRQLLHNLITNAVEALHGRDDANITVQTRVTGDASGRVVLVVVQDNGPGFPADTIEQVFEPYVTSKPKGTGLGLAIVKKIVEEHGGQIEVENLKSGGAQVRVSLPADEAGELGGVLAGTAGTVVPADTRRTETTSDA